jgi:hypothetical protein
MLLGSSTATVSADVANISESHIPLQHSGHHDPELDGAASFASIASKAITLGSATLQEAAALLSDQHAALIQAASQAVTQLAEKKAPQTTAALKSAAAQLAEQQAAFVTQLSEQGAEIKQTAAQAAIRMGERLAEGPAVLKLAALVQLNNWKTKATEGHAAFKEAATQAAARLSEQHADFVLAIGGQLTERQTELLNNAATLLAKRQAAFVEAAEEAASQLAARQTEIKQTATQAAAQLVERLAESPSVLRKAAAHLGEQHTTLHQAATEALTQLANWKLRATEVASQSAVQFAEGVADRQAALVEAATQAAQHLTEQQATLHDAISAIGKELSKRQAILGQAASQAAAALTQFCVGCGQDALRQAASLAMEQLAEHEMLLHESGADMAIALANLQAALSPSAGRIAAQLAELQQNYARELENASRTSCPVHNASDSAEKFPCVPTPDVQATKPFALPYLIVSKAVVQSISCEVPLGIALLGMVALCVYSTIHTIAKCGGEDVASLAYSSFLRRVAIWFVHRVLLGWALVLLSDCMSGAPLFLKKYDAMGWPMWSTLMPLSTQLCFFIPAAAILNTAVACGSSFCSLQETRRFYASLSREVHAAIVGCFVSDWLLFPTDLLFFGHHVLGLGIVFGVWSMVLEEAKLLAANATSVGSARQLTAINFWWVTGLSIAAMEASSFFYCLYSVMSFGAILNLSWFAVFTYSNVLSIMCMLAQHPWGTSMKVIWAAGSWLQQTIERAQVTFPHLPIPQWLSSKTTSDSVSYLWKSFMITAICLARHQQMWIYVHEQLSSSSVIIVGGLCMLLAGASVWRLKDFEKHPDPQDTD